MGIEANEKEALELFAMVDTNSDGKISHIGDGISKFSQTDGKN